MAIDGVEYCANCYAKEFVSCAECGDTTQRDSTTEVDGDYYCGDCYADNFVVCDDCSAIIRVEDEREQGGISYCEDCHGARFFLCDSCGDIFANECRLTCDGDSNLYCEDCYYDRYTTCTGCGVELSVDDATYTDNGGYCFDCYPGTGWCPEFFKPGESFTRIGSRRRFGIELEVNVATEYEDLQGDTCFGCKEDGSLGELGKEFYSPILSSDAGLEAIEGFCELAQEFELDQCCGYHLHLDMVNTPIDARERITDGYILTEEIWQSFVYSGRRDNRFCHPIENTEDEFPCSVSTDRQCWLNLYALAQHGTIEIRLHTSTLNSEKVSNWIKAHLRFADWCEAHTPNEIGRAFCGPMQDKFDALCDIIGPELGEFYAARAVKFGTPLRVREIA